MQYTQIVNVNDCILRVVYNWDADEELVGDIISVDLEEGNIVDIMSDEAYEELGDEIYNLHDDELPDS